VAQPSRIFFGLFVQHFDIILAYMMLMMDLAYRYLYYRLFWFVIEIRVRCYGYELAQPIASTFQDKFGVGG
jgi:hypothetical protein